LCKDLEIHEKLEKVVKSLHNQNKTIATMESCTGGQVASEITNIEGASNVLRESYVTYCNEAKIKFGVPAEVIDKYTVYSYETALAMAEAVRLGAKADIGIGVTGQIARCSGEKYEGANTVYFSIVDNEKQIQCKIFIKENNLLRFQKKQIVVREIAELLQEVQ